MTLVCKCLICGHDVPDGEDEKHNLPLQHVNLLNFWKNECSKTICDMLFGGENADVFLRHFQTSKYCSNCDQIIRDVHFYWTQIQLFQTKIRSLIQVTRNLISENVESNKTKKLTTEKLDSLVSAVVAKGAVALKMYSKTEIVEIMYAVSQMQRNLSDEFTTLDKNPIIKSENIVCESAPVDVKMEDFSNDEDDNLLDDNLELPETESDIDPEVENSNILPTKRKPPTVRVFKEIKKPKVREDKDDTWTPVRAQKKKKIDKRPAVVTPEVIFDFSKRMDLRKANLSREEKLKIYKIRKSGMAKAKTRTKWFQCTEENCSETFRFKKMVDGHVREVHKGEENPHHCQHCPHKFQEYKDLKRHLHNRHPQKKLGSIKNHFCKFCGKGYVQEEELNGHLAVSHQGPNPFKCGFCELEYTHSTALRKHVKELHSDVKKIPCDECGKHYRKGGDMARHLLTHKTSYKCEFCDKLYRTLDSLNYHVKSVHQQVKPFICEICGSSWADNASLKKHIKKVHDSDNRYKCKVCDKSFKSDACCKAHEIAHTGIRDFVCKVCGKAFFTKTVLEGHELIHQEGYVPRKFHRRKKPDDVKPKPKKKEETHAKESQPVQNEISDQNYQYQFLVGAYESLENVQFLQPFN